MDKIQKNSYFFSGNRPLFPTVIIDDICSQVWWLDPMDEEALGLEDEFLLGDSLLVAPVLEEGAVKRDVYLPRYQDC